MKLPEIGHVGYIVSDVEATLESFRDLYCVEKYVLYDFVPKQAWCGGEEVHDVRFRILQILADKGPKIELIQVVSGEKTPPLKYLREKGPGIHHVAYYVEDYERWRGYYSKLPGAVISFEIVAEDAVMGRRRSFYVERPGTPGVLEFSERTKH